MISCREPTYVKGILSWIYWKPYLSNYLLSWKNCENLKNSGILGVCTQWMSPYEKGFPVSFLFLLKGLLSLRTLNSILSFQVGLPWICSQWFTLKYQNFLHFLNRFCVLGCTHEIQVSCAKRVLVLLDEDSKWYSSR